MRSADPPDAAAPFLVLPGDGSADWIPGEALSPRVVPDAVDPTLHDPATSSRS